MKLLYIDCPSGVSGDMFLGGLLGLRVDLEHIRAKLNTLPVTGWQLDATLKSVNGIQCVDVTVASDEVQPHRGLEAIERIICDSGIGDDEKKLALAIFRRLAAAEAKVHGMSVNDIHFHEVGAIDAIIDICGAAIGMVALAPDKVICSPLPVGSGFVECMHGEIAVPAPATVELLTGAPVYSNGVVGELVTPTGAAIVSTICDGYGDMPIMRVIKTGYGAGKRKMAIPNAVRLFWGECSTELDTDEVVVLECNIDDMTPEAFGYAATRLMDAGALDVWLTPVQMKKGRPGVVLGVIAAPPDMNTMISVIFKETSSFGVRYRKESRWKLSRKSEVVKTAYGDVSVKVGHADGICHKAVPEYEDCARIARETGAPFIAVYEAAKAARRQGGDGC